MIAAIALNIHERPCVIRDTLVGTQGLIDLLYDAKVLAYALKPGDGTLGGELEAQYRKYGLS